MQILLKIDGWIKHENVSENIARSDKIEVGFFPPMSNLVPGDHDKPYSGREPLFAKFYYRGRDSRGIPIFEYKA